LVAHAADACEAYSADIRVSDRRNTLRYRALRADRAAQHFRAPKLIEPFDAGPIGA
jgi:hypothetical protein